MPRAIPGDICAVAKVDELHFDAVLHDAAEDEHIHLKPLAFPVPVHGATGSGHACFRVPGPALDFWVKKLEEAGVSIEADFFWPNGARSIYFRDPAGNSLECAEPGLWNIA